MTSPSSSSSSSKLLQLQSPWPLILDLMAHLLDPQTLALASCVSRSWHSTLSSNHHWLPHCISHYPSITTCTTTSPRRLFSLLRTSSSRRNRTPCTPRISVDALIFSIDIFHQHGKPILSLLKFGGELNMKNHHQIFRFDVDNFEGNREEEVEGVELRVVWNVVMKGWGGAFMMMDRVGKGKRVVSSKEDEEEMWFCEELPGPTCCSRLGGGGGGLMAEVVVGLGVRGEEGGSRKRRRVERVGLGLMSGVEWRYLSVDDALIYLQHFLLST